MQNNRKAKFSLNFNSQDVPLHDCRMYKSHHSVLGVLEDFFFRRGRLQALLPTSTPMRLCFPPLLPPPPPPLAPQLP